MSDKRFKLLLITAALTTIIVAFIWKYPEVAKVHESRLSTSKEYVYIDQNDVLHISRKCPKLNYKGYQSERLPRKELSSLNQFNFCPHCVSDKDFTQLKELIEQNIERGREKAVIDESVKKIKALYDTFVKEGYEMESEADFRKNLADPVKRRRAYDALVNDGYDMETFSEFERNIGFEPSTISTYFITTSDGKTHNVNVDNINKYGIEAYAEAYKGATIHMRDKQGADYDIPLQHYQSAMSHGLNAVEYLLDPVMYDTIPLARLLK